MRQALVTVLQSFVEYATVDLTERIARYLEGIDDWRTPRKNLHIPSTQLNSILTEIVAIASNAGVSPAETALALRTAGAVEARHRNTLDLELVLSGPTFPPFEMRRTDEAILQIIQNARRRLTIVSFVLYRIERLTRALEEASQRGVEIRLFVELDTVSERDLAMFTRAPYGATTQIYVWSKQYRLLNSNGKPGVLHAKVSIADSSVLFISSANITEHAMSFNIELGVMLRDADYARKVEQLFDNYVSYGLFERLSVNR